MSPIVEILVGVVPVLVALLITFGSLKRGQSDQHDALEEHVKAQNETARLLREDIAAVRSGMQSASKDSAVLGERFSALASSFDRNSQDNRLVLDELKGELKHHGRKIHDLELWRAEVKGRGDS